MRPSPVHPGRPAPAGLAATGPGLATTTTTTTTTTTGGRFYRALLWLFGPTLDPEEPSDMLVVVDAEDVFDAAPQLHHITAPTLVVAGDRDRCYTPELFCETAAGIPGAGCGCTRARATPASPRCATSPPSAKSSGS